MATLKVSVSPEDHIQGDGAAAVMLVEYGDYECPHCGHAHPIIRRIQRHFGQRLAFVFRNFPLGEIHPYAQRAAEAAEFAGAHGRFWEMHDGIFENQEQLSLPFLLELAGRLGLSAPDLQSAWDSGAYTQRVKADFMGGVRSGVNGTPTFFIDGHRHDDSFDFDTLRSAIEILLV
jgi:protein-disulfide isomerase